MNQRGNLSFVALFVVILLLVMGFIYVLLQKYSIKNIPTSITQSPSPQFTPNPDKTSLLNTNWKTYQASDLHFSLQYPSFATIEDDNFVLHDLTDIAIAYDTREKLLPNSSGDDTFEINIIEEKSNETLQQLLNDVKSKQSNKTGMINNVTAIKPYKLGGVDGYYYDIYQDNGDQISKTENIMVKNNGSVYYISYYGINPSLVTGRGKAIVEQMLSSFKFLDHSPLPSVSCLPKPACLDATPRCMIAEPVNGWCK